MKKFLAMLLVAGAATLFAADVPVNLVKDGNFSQNFAAWAINPRPFGKIVPKAGPDGQNVFSIQGPMDGNGLYLYNRGDKALMNLDPAKTYTLSAWIRLKNPGKPSTYGKGVVYLINYGWKASAVVPISNTDDAWQRCAVTFQPPKQGREVPANQYAYRVLVYIPAKFADAIELTDIQLEEGDKATKFQSVPYTPAQ